MGPGVLGNVERDAQQGQIEQELHGLGLDVGGFGLEHGVVNN